MHRALRIALTTAFLLAALAPQPLASDREAVERAVRDYVESIEQARPELIDRSVHPKLVKFGYYRAAPGAEVQPMPMDFAALREIARTFKDAGHVPDNPTHSIEIYEVLDRTAAAKLVGFWGSDYIHLVKEDGRWLILHVLWQSPPE